MVHALGGMGKTQLALAYTKRQWVLGGVLANSKDLDKLKRGYSTAANRIYLDHPSLALSKAIAEVNNLDEVTQAVKRWLSSTRNNQWLIIYEDYGTPKLPGYNSAGILHIKRSPPIISRSLNYHESENGSC